MSKRKSNSDDETNPNHDFCEFLLELAEYEKNVTRDIHRFNAYRKAANILRLHPTRIQSGDEARKLPGIGKKISAKIDEFLQTGKLRKLDTIHGDSKNAAINLLTRVSGIGPAKAQQLVNDGITTIEDLRKHQDCLTHHQKVGLKYFNDFEMKIPRKEIEQIETIIKTHLEQYDKQLKITICGSYRRGKLESGDIDVLLTHPNYLSTDKTKKTTTILKETVEILEKNGLIIETLSIGETKFMGVCRLNDNLPARRIDIRLTPYDQYYCAILYFTGSGVFNQQMRTHAQTVGFILNEYSLRPIGSTGVPGEPVEIHSEQDIFEYINYPYKEPHERE